MTKDTTATEDEKKALLLQAEVSSRIADTLRENECQNLIELSDKLACEPEDIWRNAVATVLHRHYGTH